MKAIILDHTNIGTFYTRGKEEDIKQTDANIEMLRGCELPSHEPMTEDELEEARKTRGPFG